MYVEWFVNLDLSILGCIKENVLGIAWMVVVAEGKLVGRWDEDLFILAVQTEVDDSAFFIFFPWLRMSSDH